MFAVPGWTVPAASLAQEQARPKKAKNKQGDGVLFNDSRKRKRNTDHDGPEPGISVFEHVADSKDSSVTDRNIAELAHSSENQKKRNKETKSTHRERVDKSIAASGSEDGNAKSSLSNGSQIKRFKNKKQPRGHGQRDGVGITRSNSHEISSTATQSLPPLPTTKLTPLQAKMRNKLTSARFRHLNETLYTTSSSDALQLFTSSPDLFADYHAGFAQQVKDSWPQNPVDDYIQSIKIRGTSEPKQGALPLPRRKTGSCTIADLGCGDAPLARGCQAVVKTLRLKFHNYDLHAVNPSITKADIANLPLRDGEADIAVFCLSLMGTNWISFIEESWRVLRGDGKGEVWVAEVKSRFGRTTKGRVVDNSVGKRRKRPTSNKTTGEDDYDGAEQFGENNNAVEELDDTTDISAFIKVFTRRGFQLREGSVNKRNKMFVSMVFTKTGIPTAGKHKGMKWTGREYQKQQDGKTRFVGGQKGDEEDSLEQESSVLKPCVYKTR